MPYKKSIRLKDYDYSSDGAYFVTICTFQRARVIDKIYNSLLKRELSALEKRFSGAKVNFYVIMPNHLHVIFIFKNSKVALPKIVQAFKSLTTLKIKKMGYQQESLWQKNYYEHVIRDEKSLNKIREYIKNNPEKERIGFKS
ncbi:MAG: transposase [Candidatus Kerfeldbacteria bacterium CG08_land_8_20_14_0_20_40_16]|uniref:Transposase n=1 Tax=Candidatus Kerfeldbacteria bacterium CG08_land_8_20_14_0_20_40_16 TaxID=2014244 RepID=A0A2H0YUK9_9BACT|nr:MAG: transposase [Candidatus Kerfeldbacteria bacterium CG08_land_8_20_14_0_20_40_16]